MVEGLRGEGCTECNMLNSETMNVSGMLSTFLVLNHIV